MAEENGYHIIAHVDMELESGDMTQNSGAPIPPEEAGDNSIHQSELVSEIGDEKGLDSLAEETTDAVEQEDGALEKNNDLSEGTIQKTSSPVETDPTDDQVRKKSTAVIIGANHKFQVRSRYLSASMSSCHDLCKFGHKHEQEQKPRRPMLGSGRDARPMMRTTSDDLATSVLNKETKKKIYRRRLSLPSTISEKDPPENSENTNHSEKDRNRSRLKTIQSEIKPSPVANSEHSSSRSKTDVQAGKKMATESPKVLEITSKRVKEIKTRKEPGSHSKAGKEKAKEPMNNLTSPKMPLKKSPSIKTLSPKTPVLKKSPSLRAKLFKNIKSFPQSKNQTNPDKAKIGGSDEASEKKLNITEPDTDERPARKTSKVATPKNSSPSTPRRSQANKGKGFQVSPRGTQVGQSSSSAPSAAVSATATAQEHQDLESTNNKQMGTIKTNSGSKPSTPRAKPTGSKPSTPRAKPTGSKPSTPRAKSAGDSRMNGKRTGIIHAEENDGSSWKVKFKRGTVVALQVANSAPKKLRFKRRNLVDHQNAKDHETPKSLKSKEDTRNEVHDTKPENGKVRLRHQEASGKKDDVDLNNVIEETASKLVKTRKSKVKALVGAFETVMSLRDRKPLVETGAS